MRVDIEDFEHKYASDPDPWSFARSPYEQRRYDVTMAALPRARYERCFEPGCSIGTLTERLATRVDRVVACDASASAITTARARLAGIGNIDFRHGAIPEEWPDGCFDLIVFSELGYYWDASELDVITRRVIASLRPGGELIAVHWTGESADHVLGGREVHDVIGRTAVGRVDTHVTAAVDDGFVLDVWRR